MNTRTTNKVIRPLALVLAVSMGITPAVYTPAASAQSYGATQEQPAFTQQELDQMLAPIALYPDSLLSQILMASTYPLEVVQAARWSRANSHLKGDDAVRAIESRDWDPSVKSLVAFPQILDMMDQKLDWTERLGDAFLAQQPQLMDTVQQLRHRAYAAGNLRSDDRIRVMPQERVIVIEPAQPQIVYVPYYNPVVVYGSWWWPHHPPVYWSPWPGYHARPGLSVNFFWGSGISLSTGFFFGGFDWHRRHARIVHVHNHYYHRPAVIHRDNHVAHTRSVNAAPGQWRHDPDHRRGVPYRAASLRQQYSRNDDDGRRDSRGRDTTTINRSQDNRRDERGPDVRLQNTTDGRADRRERNDDRPEVRDPRAPAPRTGVNANARPDAQQQNSNRPDARGGVSRTEPTIVRPDGRERGQNRPNPRDARGTATQNNGRPDVRAQETNSRSDARDARGSGPRVENSRVEVRDTRLTPQSRPAAAVERGSAAPTEIRNAAIPVSSAQVRSDQKSSPEPRRLQENSGPRSAGNSGGPRPPGEPNNGGRQDQQRKQ